MIISENLGILIMLSMIGEIADYIPNLQVQVFGVENDL